MIAVKRPEVEGIVNADQVSVDPRYPALLDAAVPQTDADMAELLRHLGLDSAAEVVELMLGQNIDVLPSIAKPLYKEMVKRASVVMRCKKSEVEQLFRDLTPQNVDVLVPRLRDIYRLSAGLVSSVVSGRRGSFKAQTEFPERLRAVLEQASARDPGLVQDLQFVIEHHGPKESRIRIVGATARDVSSVFRSTKNTGLGAQRVGADLFVTCANHLWIGEELVSFVGRVQGALGAVAQIRSNEDGSLLERYEVGDRARSLRLLEYVEMNASRGLSYVKYIDMLRDLQIERFPDLQARLETAIEISTMPEEVRDAERWIGYVEDAARKGFLYAKGVEALRELDLTEMPKVQARLEAAKMRAQRAVALKWLGYVETAARKGYIYTRGIDMLRGEAFDLRSEAFADIGARLDVVLSNTSLRGPYEASTGKTVVPSDQAPQTAGVWKSPAATAGDGNEGPLVFVLRLGAEYPVTAKDVETYGPQLIGYVGQPGRRAYWREPTADEVEAYEHSNALAFSENAADVEGVTDSTDCLVDRVRG